MSLLFGVTTFVAAALTFLLEPFVAKMLLPWYGGTPAVWNTCVLFFQGVLLAAYGYAHLLGSGNRWRRWIPAHLALMAIPLAMVPIAIDSDSAPRAGVPPFLSQFGMLVTIVGLPFFAVATTTPLVQRWLAGTGAAAGRDPYPLYAASNLGSLMALLAYPVVIEPWLDLTEVSRLWTAGYVVLLLLLGGCAAATLRGVRQPPESGVGWPVEDQVRIPASLRWRWLALAFVPSSLMLSVTTHLSTDVASAPLLWVLPLALYLVTYILAFARRRIFRTAALERAMPLIVLLLATVLLTEGLEPPPWLQFPLHLGGLVAIALACHGQLADRRPPVARLTEFYFWVALGGLAGGVFNALIAPALFNGILEYPLVLVLACLLRRPPEGSGGGLPMTWRQFLRRDAAPAIGVGLVVMALAMLASILGFSEGPATLGLTLGAPVLACYLLLMRPVRFALAVGALFLTAGWGLTSKREVVFADRTYYGLHRVRRDATWTRLYHGPTLHGVQNSEPEQRAEPLAYYHRSGPAGSLFRVLERSGRPPDRVGVIGAGVGALAAYGREGQQWTFYELDPTVISLARDSGFFSYWADSAANLSVVPGDARLSLAREPEETYDLLILDAFSSDAVPAHLLTREALELYRRRLSPRGVLAFHISNRFLDLESVVLGLARHAGLEAVFRADLALSQADRAAGKLPSHWGILTADENLIGTLRASEGWSGPTSGARGVLWTDQFSNLMNVFRWSG